MKNLNIIKYILTTAAIIFIFFNWQIAIILFIISTLLHTFPMGPDRILTLITGELIMAGLVFLFINWKIAIVLILGGFLIAKFRIWGNQKNYEHYVQKNKNKAPKKEKE